MGKPTGNKNLEEKKNKLKVKMKNTDDKVGRTMFSANKNWEIFLNSQNKNLSNGYRKETQIKLAKSRPVQLYNNKNNTGKHVCEQEKYDTKSVKSQIWFDDVDPSLLNLPNNNTKNDVTKMAATKFSNNITRYIALDCEMVGVGLEGKESVLARVSIVNSLGECVYDKFVRTTESVVDYRTEFSGVRPENLKDAPDYESVQKEVADIIKGRILIGHALKNDLKVLMLSHPRKYIRDTAKYKPFKKLLKTNRPALRNLAAELLKEKIQEGEHSSVVDAQATMKIFQKHKKEWEKSLRLGKNLKKQDKLKVKSEDIFMGKEESKKRNNKWTKRKQLQKKKKNKENF